MSIVDEVKQRLDIVDVVSERVALTKSGRSLRALCPFHTEKTPSFHVFPESQTWRCFGACATGGDVFSFVMKAEGVDFGEALRSLAQRSGVSLDSQRSRAEEEKRSRLLAANAAAAEYYHQLLLHHPDAAHAREYCGRRGLDAEVVTRFQLGYSRDDWHDLEGHLEERGYTKEELVEAGLLSRRQDGGTYDLFRGRLMFPIWDRRGRVAGFGARALGEATPKYINSPQSPIFDKSALLYGLDKAREAIRQNGRAVIVEGYTDVIAAHQAGMTNVVASMGTSLTEKQVASLRNLAKDICITLDADAAGQEATRRGLQVAATMSVEQRGVEVPTRWGKVSYQSLPQATVHAAVLPAGRDPDEVIRSDPELWQRLLEQAPPLLDYLIETALKAVDMNNPRDKAAVADELLTVIQQIHHPVERDDHLQRLARHLGLDEAPLREALRSRSARPRPPTRRREEAPKEAAPRLRPRGDALEQFCLSLLLQYTWEPAAPKVSLQAEHFEYPDNRAVFLAWQEAPQVDALRERLPKDVWPHLDRLLAAPLPPGSVDDRRRALTEVQNRLEERRLRAIKLQQSQALAAEEEATSPEAEKLARLQQEGLEPSQKLRHLFRARTQSE